MARARSNDQPKSVDAAIDHVIKLMNEETEGSVTKASDGSISDIRTFVPTGIDILDAILGGGMPSGKIVEIFGPESQGKSTLLEHIYAGYQRAGGVVAMIDSESSFNRQRATMIGVDTKRMMFFEADTLEQGVDSILSFINKVKQVEALQTIPLVIGWDTIAAAKTQAEQDHADDPANNGKWGAGMASKARTMKEVFRLITREIAKLNITVIFLNQVHSKIGGYGGEDTPAGNALKFHASLRIRPQRQSIIYDADENPIGMAVGIWIAKSKICRPEQEFVITMMYDTGVDNARTLLDNCTGTWKEGYPIEQASGYYYYNNGTKDGVCFYAKDFDEVTKKYPEIVPACAKYLKDTLSPFWYKDLMRLKPLFQEEGEDLPMLPSSWLVLDERERNNKSKAIEA